MSERRAAPPSGEKIGLQVYDKYRYFQYFQTYGLCA